MFKSSDPQNFFETDADQAKRERRAAKADNKYGNPIILKSKILAVTPDPRSPSSTIYVAESAGSIRKVNLDDNDTKAVYRGPTAPLTCVAIGGQDSKTVFAGSWDKAVWSWDSETRAPGRKFIGHSDFVKAVTCTRIGGKDILISGGADKKIIVWDIGTGARLHTLQDSAVNMLAMQDLAVDPVQSDTNEIFLVSASSDPHIRRWRISLESWEQLEEVNPDTPDADRRTILEHETSVYKLVFDHDGEEVDLWTSSGDGTAKCLSRIKGFTAEESFNHGDHVRAVAVTERWVITAGRDEDLKFWDRSSGKLHCSLEGHYDEITDIAIVKGSPERLVSVSIDGTIRTWPLAAASLDALVQEQKDAAIIGVGIEQDGKADDLLTADEEAELAALMDDDD
ncbi:WD40-repeat-containing domain protein [Phialemonium atrogriseum]|uniref:WD40-repeat-containing domain protein n=1 Tax=Phialemonium atrogriseum TaxID=1093897 RepID=A0AAJ0FRL6_9PEZI|nr:WD40-repeat-containing domain protein [Phialemonium atrogriseum]KAK1772408.1 WD40-repeat-containing domain protein [Phialemonium atrogriseum]